MSRFRTAPRPGSVTLARGRHPTRVWSLRLFRVIRVLLLALMGTLIAAGVRYRAMVRDEPPAPELTSRAGWLNTDRPLRLSEELKGHVVVLDFWTYCCINCMHVLPDLEYLEEKYKDEPVVVIGVHSAKFSNESQRESIRNAIFRYHIRHPVVIDSNQTLWRAYEARGWPSFVVIGADGKRVPIHNRFGTPIFTIGGEGQRQALDDAVATALDDGRNTGLLATKKVVIKADASVASSSGLSFPGKVIAAPPKENQSGYVFISDSSHHRVLITSWPVESESSAGSRLLWTVGDGTPGLVDGAADGARFNDPQGLAYDAPSRTLYVADRRNHAIRAIDLGVLQSPTAANRPAVRTILGHGVQVNDRAGGKVGRAQGISSPWDVALGPDAQLYIAMAGTHQIWKLDLATQQASAFAGSGVEDLQDAPADLASLAQTSALAFTPDASRLYFADSETSSLRYVDMGDRTVHTIVGHGLFDFGDVSNTFVRSRFQHCLGAAVLARADGTHDVLVADTYNHKVKLVDLHAQRVSDFLGVGRMENAKSASDLVLDEPGGVCLVPNDHEPRLFIADTNNHRVIVANPGTKQWRELIIDGLDGAREAAPGDARPVTLQVAPGKDLRLDLTPRLAEGASPNPEAPVMIRVRAREGDGLGATLAQRTVRSGVFPVSITIPAASVAAGARFVVEVAFASCTHDDYGICRPGSAAWDVTLEAGAKSAAELKAE